MPRRCPPTRRRRTRPTSPDLPPSRWPTRSRRPTANEAAPETPADSCPRASRHRRRGPDSGRPPDELPRAIGRGRGARAGHGRGGTAAVEDEPDPPVEASAAAPAADLRRPDDVGHRRDRRSARADATEPVNTAEPEPAEPADRAGHRPTTAAPTRRRGAPRRRRRTRRRDHAHAPGRRGGGASAATAPTGEHAADHRDPGAPVTRTVPSSSGPAPRAGPAPTPPCRPRPRRARAPVASGPGCAERRRGRADGAGARSDPVGPDPAVGAP